MLSEYLWNWDQVPPYLTPPYPSILKAPLPLPRSPFSITLYFLSMFWGDAQCISYFEPHPGPWYFIMALSFTMIYSLQWHELAVMRAWYSTICCTTRSFGFLTQDETEYWMYVWLTERIIQISYFCNWSFQWGWKTFGILSVHVSVPLFFF